MTSNSTVKFNDFTRLDFADELDAMRGVMESGWLILGNEVQQFEKAWADRCGVKYAIGVGNGLDAIEIGLRALGIGTGDEVITTPMTAVATVLGIVRAGAKPVLADVDPATALLDPLSVERCITSRTKAVLLVHLYGQMRTMDAWVNFCRERGILLLEDCAQAHDAHFNGRAAGAWGAFGAYSFYPTKNLGAAGDAGALVTSDSNLAETARSLRNYGQTNRYEHPVIGLNSRLDEIQAALLTQRMGKLTGWTAHRREVAATYRDQIDNSAVSLLAAPEAAENHVHHLFVVTTRWRSDLQRHLAQCGIESLAHYPIAIHHQEPFRDISRDPAGLEHAESHAQSCLSLPCAPHLSESEVTRVVDAVNSFTVQ